MQQIWDEHQAKWNDQVAFVVVNGNGLEDGLDNLATDHPEVVLPVMQDDSKTRCPSFRLLAMIRLPSLQQPLRH